MNVKASLHFLGHSHHETEPAPAPAPRPRAKDDDDDDGSRACIFLIVFFVILFAVFNSWRSSSTRSGSANASRTQRRNRFVPPPTYLHPSLHHKTFPGAGPAASYRGGPARDELQPTESFRNVRPSASSGRSAGTTWGKAFA